MYGQQVSGVGL